MRIIEDQCVGCPDGICIGSACKYKNVECFYCDDCGDQTTLYDFDGMELCIDCVAKRLSVIEGSEDYV